MTRGRVVGGLAVLAAALALPASANAALRWRGCEDGDDCARLVVPLDRTGVVPGSVSLRVLRERAERRPPAGVTLLVGGDPGDSSIGWFAGDFAETLGDAGPRNDVIVLDQRGTGGSGPLRCRDLEAASATDAGREAAACAALLGERRGFYRTSETVADIEALRVELGVERLAIVGIGYGGYAAQRYALSHPGRVDRLVLYSPVDAAGLDPLRLDSIAAARRVLPLICRSGCRSFTRDVVADTARLGARLAGRPLRGRVVGLEGSRRRATLSSQELLFTMISADRNVLSRMDYPAAVVAALRGDPAPLFRLKRRAVVAAKTTRPGLSSAATRAAVLCEDVRFPWPWRAGPAERDAATAAAGQLLSAELASPFGTAAAIRSDLMRLCRRWSTASAAAPDEPDPMPDVPALVIAHDATLQGSVEAARRTASRYPRGELLVAPTLVSPLLGEVDCVSDALELFFAGRPVTTRCPRSFRFIPPGVPPPTALSELEPVRGVPGRRGRVLRAVGLTLGDLVDDFYSSGLLGPEALLERPRIRGTGLRGGSYRYLPDQEVMRVERFEFVPGVRLSYSGEAEFLTVDGPGSIDGRLASGDADDEGLRVPVRGRLGGRKVRARLRVDSRILEALIRFDDSDSAAGPSVRPPRSARPRPAAF